MFTYKKHKHMKKVITSLVTLFISTIGFSCYVDNPEVIDINNFNLQKALMYYNGIDCNGDGSIQVDETFEVYHIYLVNQGDNVYDLSDLKHFPMLNKVTIINTKISSFYWEGQENLLEELTIENVEIDDFNIFNNMSSLKTLKINNSDNLINLDLSKNTKLTSLDCQSNANLTTVCLPSSMKSIYVNEFKKDTTVEWSKECGHNIVNLQNNLRTYLIDLPKVNINNDEYIQYFEAQRITDTLDIQVLNNPEDIYGIEAFYNLTGLNINGGGLEKLDVSSMTELHYLNCNRNELTSLDLSANTKLRYLECEKNYLTDLTVNDSLIHINYSNNYFEKFPTMPEVIQFIDCSGNNHIEKVLFNSVSFPKDLDTLIISHNYHLAGFFASKYTKLKYLDYSYTYFTKSMDFHDYPELKYLACERNHLNEIDLSGNPDLEYLNIMNQRVDLTFLDVSKNTKLKYLNCSNNALDTLLVHDSTIVNQRILNNTKYSLEELDCSNNNLTSLNISKCENLTNVDCTNNPFLENIYVPFTITSSEFKKDITAEWIEPIVTSSTNVELSIDDNVEVIKAYNIQGKEVSINTKGEPIILLYSNGVKRKIFKH